MQLTSFTDYGLRALIYMASLPEGKMTSITEVTEIYGVSRNHMVKIINQLSREGYVAAVRGKNGGIRLGRAAKDICIGDVVRDLEPWRWLTAAVSFAISLPPAALSGRFLRLCKVFSRSWITTRWPIWLKRINRFTNYCWWKNKSPDHFALHRGGN